MTESTPVAGPDPTATPPSVPPALLPTPNGLLVAAKPGRLYHYTDQRGLLGILDSGKLWATSIRFLNDSQEYQVGLTRIAREIQQRIGQQSDLEGLLSGILDLAAWTTPTVGVVSFSEVRDDLGQWRAYSGGSGGYALGWDGQALMRQINAGHGALVPVIYGNSAHPQEHDRIVASFCDEIIAESRTLTADQEERRRFQQRCNSSVQVVCSILKDWAFHAEREWRGIVMSPAGQRVHLKVRPGRSTLIPYYDVSVREEALFTNRLPLTEIIAGPTPHPDLARQATITALAINGENHPVALSEVPFRNW